MTITPYVSRVNIMIALASILLWMNIGCQPEPEYGICEDICIEVYSTCQFAAYPSFESCLEGCFYNEEEGADMNAQYECFQEAACDTFEIVECENTYGAQSDD